MRRRYSFLLRGGGKMKDPGNEVAQRFPKLFLIYRRFAGYLEGLRKSRKFSGYQGFWDTSDCTAGYIEFTPQKCFGKDKKWLVLRKSKRHSLTTKTERREIHSVVSRTLGSEGTMTAVLKAATGPTNSRTL